MKAHLGERDLIKALRDQGFQVEETSDGYRVSSDKGSTTFHPSSLDAAPGIYQQVVAKLRRIGFVEPNDFKLQQIAAKREARLERERVEREAGPYVCEDCGEEYPYIRSRARHQSSARHGTYRDTPLILPTTTKPKVKHEPDELKAKRLVRKLKEQIAAVNHTTDELISLVEPLEESNHKMREKLKRLEGVVGKLVEEI